MSIRNVAITSGGTAQDALPARPGRTFLEIDPITESCWVNFGTNAAVDTGVLIDVDEKPPRRFCVEDAPDIGGRVSIFSATTGAKIIIRET